MKLTKNFKVTSYHYEGNNIVAEVLQNGVYDYKEIPLVEFKSWLKDNDKLEILTEGFDGDYTCTTKKISFEYYRACCDGYTKDDLHEYLSVREASKVVVNDIFQQLGKIFQPC